MIEEQPKPEYENIPLDMGAAIVAESLAQELGSAQSFGDDGRTDMRIMTMIKNSDIPFLLYASMRSRKSRVWRQIYDQILHLKVGVGGRGRRDIIRMEQVARGGQAEVREEIPEPGWVQRNVTDRKWKEKQSNVTGE